MHQCLFETFIIYRTFDEINSELLREIELPYRILRIFAIKSTVNVITGNSITDFGKFEIQKE